MNYTIKKSKFNTKNGKSRVTIQTELGDFTALCKLHEEDADIQSRFFGCEVAEMRACLKYLKARKRMLVSNYNLLVNLHTNMSRMNGFNKDSLEARQLRKNSFILKDKIQVQNQIIETLAQRIHDKIYNYREEKTASLDHIKKRLKKQ